MAGTAAGAAKRAAARAGAATPTDRQPKAVVRKPTPAELAEMPDAQVETLGEDVADDVADDGSVEVEFDGNVFLVKSPGDWPNSANEAVQNAMFGTWARAVMDKRSADLWAEIDLTNRECYAFMRAYDEAYAARYGSDPKAIARQLGLSRSTRRS